MTRVLAIFLSSAALLVVALACFAIIVEVFSVLVRPIEFSLRLGRHSIAVPPFHWTIWVALACIAVVVVALLWPYVFPSRMTT